MTKEQAKKEYKKICNINTFGFDVFELMDINNYKNYLLNIINKK